MLSHVDENGQANMVDVSLKEVTLRDASAEAYIKMSKQAFEQMTDAQKCFFNTAWQAFGPEKRHRNDVPEFGKAVVDE